ncbi:serine hydrolase [Amycolatopsis sp. NPDC003676]
MPFTGLDAWSSARAAADEFSGAVLIQRGAEVLFSGAYGLATRRWAVPNRLDLRFDTASITKFFTAVAAFAADGPRTTGPAHAPPGSPTTLTRKRGRATGR